MKLYVTDFFIVICMDSHAPIYVHVIIIIIIIITAVSIPIIFLENIIFQKRLFAVVVVAKDEIIVSCVTSVVSRSFETFVAYYVFPFFGWGILAIL